MKKQENEVRSKMVVTRMNLFEFEKMESFRKHSTERSISNYIRKVVTQKPVIMNYRNQSADEFLNQMLELKKDLNGIGNNFNQAVHKLHILDTIPEFRMWIGQYTNLHKKLVEKVEEIKLRMNQLYDQWLQK